MVAQVYYSPFIPAFSGNGLPLPGARLYFFDTGTTDPAPIYEDSALTIPMENPVEANLAARFPNIYMDGDLVYRVRITDQYGTPLQTDIDPYYPGQALVVVPDTPEFAAADGASLVGFVQQEADAVARTVENKLRETISLLDFIPANLHAGILDRSGTTNLSPYIQNAIDATPPGVGLYAPDGVYRMTAGVTGENTITLFGDPGRDNMDNSWDIGDGGTIFDYRGAIGDAFNFTAPNAVNSRINVCLRDFLVRGSRVTAAGTSGNCITIDGTAQIATFVRLHMENVHCVEAPHRGLSLVNQVYGGTISNCFFHRCGRNGFGTTAGLNVGEIVMGRIRCFDNGQTAGTAQEQTNFLWLAGTLKIDMLSASESGGTGVILGGGPIHIGFLQAESNVGNAVVLGQPGAGVQLVLDGWLIAPGDGFTGKHIHITADTARVSLNAAGGYFADTLGVGGTHITRDVGAGDVDFGSVPFRSQVALVIDDNAVTHATHLVCQVWARNATAGVDVTGDGTEVDWVLSAEILDTHAAFNPATGVFTAPVSGLYDIEVAIPLAGLGAGHDRADLKIVATSYSRTYRLGNVGAMRDANNLFTIQGRARVPMVQGETLKVVFSVGGSTKTVDVTGDALYGFLSICTAH